MRTAHLALTVIASICAASCTQGPESSKDAAVAVPDAQDEVPQPANEAGAGIDAGAVAEIGTPMEERVATLGLLNKRNNTSRDIEIRPGETQEFGDIRISLSACERTAPWEMRRETGAFVQVDVQPRGSSEFERIFSGWLFKNSPSLNVVEHGIYDVWVKDCAMSFPGEE